MNARKREQKIRLRLALKPRNPLVPAAAARKAGAHGKGRGAQRQEARRRMRRELEAEFPARPAGGSDDPTRRQ